MSQDAVWFSLEQWGRGASGYGKNWLEYATYFYDWIPTAGSDHPAFVLSETRIMNIVRASKDPLARERLLQASLVGDFASLSDEEFKWTTGQSLSTFPLEQDVLAALMRAGVEVMQTGLLGPETKRSFLETLHGLRTSRLKSSKSEVEDDEDQ